MINLFRKNLITKSRGAATLITTVVLLVTSTLIVIFAATQGRLLNNITSNQVRSSQAFHAAEYGMEYAINYLQQNSTAILANPVSGFIPSYSDSNTLNVSLTNGTKYTITYSNTVANNYNLIKILSTGSSADNSATRVVGQQVQFGSLLASPPNIPLVTKGSLSMTGNAIISNTSNSSTIQAGSGVSFNGNAATMLNSGISSNSSQTNSDVQQNISSISNMSQNDFFATYFGTQTETIKNKVAHYYSNGASTNYSSTLNGMTGTSIWIDQTSGTASISGNTVIGTAANPVLIIINGNATLSGNVVINGFLFVIGAATATTDISGNVTITGGIVASDNFNISGNTLVTYNPAVIDALQNSSSMKYYAKVPGTWSDF